MTKAFRDREVISVDEEVTVFVDMGSMLRTGETISGTPTVTEVGSDAALTIADIAALGADTTIPEDSPLYGGYDEIVQSGTGFLFTVIASSAGEHSVKATVVTTGVTPAQTLIREIVFSAV